MTTPRNLYACLVHERPDCVLDLVRNLRHLDPASPILLYDGGADPGLLQCGSSLERYGAVVHPAPRPMKWGQLHDFALDAMRFGLEHLPFDTLTIVDSDQLGARRGFPERIGAFLAAQPAAGLLGSAPPTVPGQKLAAPAQQARRELDLWRPFLRRFAGGEEKFPQWTFWPSTVFTADAARALLELWDRDQTIPDLLRRSQLWATEEVLLPTLVALLGFEVARSPCSYDYVRFRARYTPGQVEAALAHPDVYWLHPIPRRYEDPLRSRVRARLGEYGAPVAAELAPAPGAATVFTGALLAEVRAIEGWLSDDEGRLLAEATADVLAGLPPPHALVEVGSYCGKATVLMGRVLEGRGGDALVHAIDPHDGRVGAAGQRVHETGPTRHKLERHLARAGLQSRVRILQARAPDVPWEGPISLLLIDGLHDYQSVSRDFSHLERHVVDGGYVLFHDDADYFPGVRLVVQEAVRSGRYRLLRRAGSMTLLERRCAPAPADEAPARPPRGTRETRQGAPAGEAPPPP